MQYIRAKLEKIKQNYKTLKKLKLSLSSWSDI